jgi:triacylglycerol lipase
MNKLYIILLIILNILALIGFIYIIISIITYLKFKKYELFISKVLRNKIHCGKLDCYPGFINVDIPIFSTNYDKKMAIYCIDIIQRIYDTTDNNNNKLILPKNVNLKTTIKYKSAEGIFGIICTNKDTILLIFRGTVYIDEWAKNINVEQSFFLLHQDIKNNNALQDIDLAPSVHKGFYEIYNKIKSEIFSVLNNLNPSKNKNIIITGHSLGSAIATICTVDLHYNNYKNIVTYIFACPRVGNKKFAQLIQNLPIYSIINTLDIIPSIPPAVVPNFNDINQPYIYFDAGKIARFQDNWDSILNNHLLPIYLHNLPDKIDS